MKQVISPIFQSFLVLIQQHQINNWTAKQIWNTLETLTEPKDRSTQQQLYRSLRKLVKQGYLIKQTNIENHRLSTFCESSKMDELRKTFKTNIERNELSKLESKTKELHSKQILLKQQITASEQALIDFPNLKHEILKQRNIVTNEIEQLSAYCDFLSSLHITA